MIHLDQLAFRPGWVSVPKDEWRAQQESIVQGESWIIDGNRESTMPIRLGACDTVIFLDYPRAVSTFRALKRQLLNRGRSVQAEGCPERLDVGFIRWVWRYNTAHRPRTLRLISEHARTAQLITLRRPRETERFLSSLPRHSPSEER